MKKTFFLFLLSCAIFSCTDENKKVFNGEVFIIKNKPDTDTLRGEQIKLDGLFAGFFAVYDSLIVFSSEQYRTTLNCLSLAFNLKTGKQISSLVKVGKGSGEYTMATTTRQFHIDKEIRMWFYDYFVKKICFLVDVTNNTVSDSVDISWLKNDRKEPSRRVWFLNDSLFLVFNMEEPEYTHEKIALPPVWSLYNYKTGEKLRQYDVFNRFRYEASYFSLTSEDQLKPDNTKLIMPMWYCRQINIVNMQTGEIRGYSFETGFPDYTVMEKQELESKRYYFRACVDDDFIYAAIKERDNVVIDIFDWNGNYLKRLILDKNMDEFMALDTVNKYLYILAVGDEEEEIYRYDVSYLYKR
jgi:hypothetical protein